MAFDFNSKYGKKASFTFKGDNLDFCTLEEYCSLHGLEVVPVRALYINSKAQYPHGVVVTDSIKIDLPKHLNDMVKSVTADSDAVDAINNGECGFKPHTYYDATKKLRYSGSLCNI